MTLNQSRLEIEPEFFYYYLLYWLRLIFQELNSNFFDSQLNSYSNITGDQLQQRSFDHLDSTNKNELQEF
jgi:hypothetical protein